MKHTIVITTRGSLSSPSREALRGVVERVVEVVSVADVVVVRMFVVVGVVGEVVVVVVVVGLCCL